MLKLSIFILLFYTTLLIAIEEQNVDGGWLGKNIMSYHTTELGWRTFKQTNLVRWN
jgi:hypothetical protein